MDPLIKGKTRKWLQEKACRLATVANFPKEYRVWHSLLRRVTDPRHSHWEWYHQRGLQICRRWWTFENFLEDMGLMPEGAVLSRLNRKKGFESGNCVWATRKVNLRRRRDAVVVILDGVPTPLRECAERFGISYLTLYHRWIRGWSVDRLFLVPGTAGKQAMNRRRGAQRQVVTKKRRRLTRLP